MLCVMNKAMQARQCRVRQSKGGQAKFEQQVKAAICQAWIAYHLAGTLAQRARERKYPRKYCTSLLQTMSADLHHFVLQSCHTCFQHHAQYVASHPIDKVEDYERWVFDLHNAVNVKLNKAIESDFGAVRQHYRDQAQSLGKLANITRLSAAVPAVHGRYCYNC